MVDLLMSSRALAGAGRYSRQANCASIRCGAPDRPAARSDEDALSALTRLVCTSFVPSWHGEPIPPGLPADVWRRLQLSMWWVVVAALVRHGRTFRGLAPPEREALLAGLICHPWPWLRRTARRWKEIALLTA